MKQYEKWQLMMVEAFIEKLHSEFEYIVNDVQDWLEDGEEPETMADMVSDHYDETYRDYEDFLQANGLWDDGLDEWREGKERTLRQKIYAEIDGFFEHVCHHVEAWFELDCKLFDLCTE